MSRMVDEPYFTYSTYSALTSGIQVKCPKCNRAGVVTADDENAYFRCLSCGHQETRDRTVYRYDVHNQCRNCGRCYRVDIEDEAKQHFSVLHVACPYCGTTMSGEVHKTAEAFFYAAEIKDGKEPWFGLELWFLTSFQGKPVWSLNREHLAYLIDYLSADQREKPLGIPRKTHRNRAAGGAVPRNGPAVFRWRSPPIGRYPYLGDREKALQTAKRLATERLWPGRHRFRPMSFFEDPNLRELLLEPESLRRIR